KRTKLRAGEGNVLSFSTHFRLAAQSSAHRDWEPTTPSINFEEETSSEAFLLSLREAYVSGENLLGSAQPWVGKRFYRRLDVHMLDYYLIETAGPGAGIENIGLGFGNLHLAVLRNIPSAEADDGPAQTNL